MQVGTVFKWKSFPDPQIGSEIKTRWFIYLGETGPLQYPPYAYFITTTTQFNDFESSGKRAFHTVCRFYATNSPFEQDCLADFDEGPFYRLKEELLHNPNIEVVGQLSEQYMRALYNCVLRSRMYSKIERLDIYDSYNRVGISNLKRPK